MRKRERRKAEGVDVRQKREHEWNERDDETREHRPEQHGTGYGTERAGYLTFLASRWVGSIPPTPQAYARALKQWRQLPGSIVTAPIDLGSLPSSSPPAVPDSSQEPAHDADREERQS